MNISVVIPHYKTASLLKRNLPYVFASVKKYSQGKVEIIVVDDGSEVDVLRQIKSVIEKIKSQKTEEIQIKFLHNKHNLGFASTINEGVKNAIGEVLVLLNTDVIPHEDFLEPLVFHFRDRRVFAVGCLDQSIENKKVVLRGRGLYGWKRGLFIHRRGEIDKKDTDWVSGGSGAFRKDIWEKLGGFDSLYNPFYWEDIDISYRALKSGYKILFESKSVVEHRHEEGTIRTTFNNSQIKKIAYRNQFIFIWKNITDFDLRLIHWLFLPYHLFRSFLRGDFALVIGFVSAFMKLPIIILSGSRARKLFTKSDREILKL